MEFEKPKFGTKKWFENYWYHYKWHTIAGLFLFTMLFVLVRDFASKERYDCTVLLASRTRVSMEQQERLAELLEQYQVDLDGDGVVNVMLSTVQFPPDDSGINAQMQMAEQVRFIAEISSGESMLMILDSYAEEMLGQESVEMLADLSHYSAATTEDGKRVLLKDTPLSREALLADLGDSLWISMRTEDYVKDEELLLSYPQQQAMLTRLLADEPAPR